MRYTPLRRNIAPFVAVKFSISHFNAWSKLCETLCVWKHCKSSHLFFTNGHISASNAQVTFNSLPHHLPPAFVWKGLLERAFFYSVKLSGVILFVLHILAFECREVLASVRDLQENPEFFFCSKCSRNNGIENNEQKSDVWCAITWPVQTFMVCEIFVGSFENKRWLICCYFDCTSFFATCIFLPPSFLKAFSQTHFCSLKRVQ